MFEKLGDDLDASCRVDASNETGTEKTKAGSGLHGPRPATAASCRHAGKTAHMATERIKARAERRRRYTSGRWSSQDVMKWRVVIVMTC